MAQMRATIQLIGDSIRKGSHYLPTRMLAARLASRAGPKDYLGQAEQIYRGFLKRWRYVRDPVTRELVTASPRASFRLVMAGDGIGYGDGLGAGDCDCATVALGSLYEAIGLPVRIATIAKPTAPPGPLMDHVYPEVKIPKLGWIPADPVLHPKKGFGEYPPASRKVVYDLDGTVLSYSGNLSGIGDQKMQLQNYPEVWRRAPFQTYSGLGQDNYVEDYSPAFFGSAEDGSDPAPWESVGLNRWGHLATQMGATEDGMNIPIEVGPNQTEFYQGLARTPMVELAPADYAYLQNNGRAYDGMMGLGDDGETYVYDGLGGFFKRLFRKIKKVVKKVKKKIRGGISKIVKGVRKVAGRIRKGIRSVVKRLPGGKALIKIAGKIRKVAMKVVRPISKVVGKWAGKLAPIANFIPGYGPAISAGLRIAGRVAKTFNTVDRLSRGKLPSGAGGFLKSKIPGLLGGADTDAADDTRYAIASQLPRYIM